MQFNYSIGKSFGYLTDPYKIISLIEASPGTNQGQPIDHYFERRPDSRTHHSLFWKTAYHLKGDVLHLSYRYFWDDWSIKSHTVDLQYRFELSERQYFAPHVRYYNQSAADFYHHSLRNDQTIPVYASADYRLGDLNTVTVGIKYSFTTGRSSKFSLRFEYMKQSGESYPSDAIGVLRSQDLFPDVNAVIAQLSYQVKF